jgi:hypothetical protein
MHGNRATISALYAAKIEATRRNLPGRDTAAAVRAIVAERRAAMRVIAERRQAALRGIRDRRMAERFSERRARQNARNRADARPL